MLDHDDTFGKILILTYCNAVINDTVHRLEEFHRSLVMAWYKDEREGFNCEFIDLGQGDA